MPQSNSWTNSELEAIVSDYFEMLSDELDGKPYSKTEHRNSLRQIVHRSPGSIERKHQNISAIMHELGLPWISGYKPLGNYQQALAEAVEARLVQSDGADPGETAPIPPSQEDVKEVFVSPPPPSTIGKKSERRPVGKFDQAARDAANRRLGKAGEEFAVNEEKRRLTVAGREDLAAKVRWVSKDIGDGFGYDIESYSEDGSTIFIEVKTTRGAISTPFYISNNELLVAKKKRDAYRIYRVFSFEVQPRIYVIRGPLEQFLALEPIMYRARVATL